MRRAIGFLLACGLMTGIGGSAAADDVVTLLLQNGSRLVGRVVSEDDTALKVVTSSRAAGLVTSRRMRSVGNDRAASRACAADMHALTV